MFRALMQNIRLQTKTIRVISLIILGTLAVINTAFAQEVPKDLQQFLDKFFLAVTSHNSAEVMNLMDPDYKKEQHDAFLKGNTKQFLDEFFCGYDPADGETYECMKFNEVIKLELSSHIPDIELYIVMVHVTDSDSTVEVTWMVSAKLGDDGKINFGMIGTYG
jgi:hypothetical protein